MDTRGTTDSLPEEPSRVYTSVNLHSSHEVPSWYAHNSFILTGYRPVTKSIPLCLRSLSYLHNETVNIYSHLIPGIFVLLASYSFECYFTTRFPQATWADELVFRIFLTTSVVCFGTSAAYHTLICHSQWYASLWVKADYVAIIGQIVGSFIPGLYFGFYCEPKLQKLYWSMVRLWSMEP
jgi:adiponectin receptor